MLFGTEQDGPRLAGRTRMRRTLWGLGCVSAFAMVATVATCRLSSQAAPPQSSPDATKPAVLPEANRAADAKGQADAHPEPVANKGVQPAVVQRRQEISDDSAKLLKLATDLKAAVDKTSKDTLSLGVIRKAEEIEKLAHNVREKMKLTMASN